MYTLCDRLHAYFLTLSWLIVMLYSEVVKVYFQYESPYLKRDLKLLRCVNDLIFVIFAFSECDTTVILQKLRARLGTGLTGLSPPPVIFYISDRSKAVLLIWFSVLVLVSGYVLFSHSVCLNDILLGLHVGS